MKKGSSAFLKKQKALLKAYELLQLFTWEDILRTELFQIKTREEERVEIYFTEKTTSVEKVIEAAEERPLRLIGRDNRGENRFIKTEDILYFESIDKKTFAYVKEEAYLIRESLSFIEENFQKEGFIRINKSSVINIYHIESVKPEINMRVKAVMQNGDYQIINRSYKKCFTEYLKERRRVL